jgi:ArsR family transcriptional regulator, lead/cadmium/zinc/bismuth-responsive transcriptional repressor
MQSRFPLDCCPDKPSVANRPPLSIEQAAELEAIFKLLANQTRLRMLHAVVRAREICVTDLARTLNMKPQAISNQLQRLVDRGMVAPRRNGNNIFYRIVDPCVVSLMDKGLCLMEESASGRNLAQVDAAVTSLDEKTNIGGHQT